MNSGHQFFPAPLFWEPTGSKSVLKRGLSAKLFVEVAHAFHVLRMVSAESVTRFGTGGTLPGMVVACG